MGELERIHNHLNDWGFVCNDAAFAWPHARCGALREGVLRACAVAFGHRLMMDRVVPGGVTDDLAPDGAAAILAALAVVEARSPRCSRSMRAMPACRTAWSAPASSRPALVARFAAGGHVGRASGRGFDARTAIAYAPYDGAADVPVLPQGDVDARVRIRIAELRSPSAWCAPCWPACRRRAAARAAAACRRGHRPGRGLPRRLPALGRAGRWRAGAGGLPARSVLAAMAAAGSRDRGQHRRRLPALQQELQLLLQRGDL